MAPTPSPAAIDALYNATLATARRFSSYNFQNYFVRRTNDHFGKASTPATGQQQQAGMSQEQYDARVKELEVLKRAAEVNRMFEGPKLVVEHARPITGESQGLRSLAYRREPAKSFGIFWPFRCSSKRRLSA